MDLDYIKRRAVIDTTATLLFLTGLSGNEQIAVAEPLPAAPQPAASPSQNIKPCPYSEAHLSELDMRVLASLSQKMEGSPEEIVCEIREIASHLPPKQAPSLIDQIKSWGPTELTTIGAALLGGVGVEKFKEWQDQKKREARKKDKENPPSKLIL